MGKVGWWKLGTKKLMKSFGGKSLLDYRGKASLWGMGTNPSLPPSLSLLSCPYCSLHGCLPCPLCPFHGLGRVLDCDALAHSGSGVHHPGRQHRALQTEGPGDSVQR